MSLLDIAIIYFACGTPFAVYRIALSEKGVSETLIRSVWAAILWPADGGKAAIKRLRSASRSLSRPRLEVLRAELENILLEDDPRFPRFDFREVFARYAGLAVSLPPARGSFDALFEISGSAMTSAASACLQRASQARIERHLSSARTELFEFMKPALSAHLVEVAVSLGAEVSDGSLASELSRHATKGQGFSPASLHRLSGSAS